MSRSRALSALMFIGLAWGLTSPLTKIAVSTGHSPLGLIFWQMVIGSIVLGALQGLRRRPFAVPRRAVWFCLIVALSGTVVPGVIMFTSYGKLPASVMALLLSATPLIALPVAVAFGTDRFSPARIAGLALGFCGVMLIIFASQGLPQAVAIGAILFALLAPLCYAFENNYVAWNGTEGLGPFQTLFVASCLGAIVLLPLQGLPGVFVSPLHPWGAPEYAFIAASLLHTFAYSGLIWLVGQAGAVFAVQVSFLVTTFGVLSSFVLLGERFSSILWVALVVLMAGIALVQPKEPATDG